MIVKDLLQLVLLEISYRYLTMQSRIKVIPFFLDSRSLFALFALFVGFERNSLKSLR